MYTLKYSHISGFIDEVSSYSSNLINYPGGTMSVGNQTSINSLLNVTIDAVLPEPAPKTTERLTILKVASWHSK
jgi:hypothetical protein